MDISTVHKPEVKEAFWHPAEPPDFSKGKMIGCLKWCSWCGSMHPTEVAAAIKAGAEGEFAGMKYGWPHKVYFEKVPNPHAGILESRSSISNPSQEDIDTGLYQRYPTGRFNEITGKPTYKWYGKPEPAAATTWGKFYTVHLIDATDEEREIIETHLGVHFYFTPDGRVTWSKKEKM